MPVGRVFNAAQNQILISPVSNHYQGKAIRSAQRKADIQNETAEAELENLPTKFDLDKRRMAAQERQVKAQEEGLALRREEFEREVGLDRAKEFAVDGFGITYAVDTAVQNGEIDWDGGLALAAEEFARYAETLPEGRRDEMFGVLENGLTIDEYRAVKASFIGALGQYDLLDTNAAAGGYTLSEGGRRYDKNNRMVASNPKTEKPADFNPPNKAELETAKDLLKTSEKLEDLDGKYTDIATMILANDIRQLQERFEMPYDEAAALAIKALEKKTGEEPDFFTGTDSKLKIGSDELADGEYKGIDGHVYVGGPDGSFRRKD